MQSVNPDTLAEQLVAFHARFAAYFYRAEVRERSARYIQALLSPVPRKNGWQLAEAIGDPDPNGAQRLLYAARWDADAVRDELIRVVDATFGDAEEGIFVIDETGFLKKGTKSAGVARQYSGTAGKIENCQIGVFLSYTSPTGTAFLDRRLYLPQHWSGDAVRRAAAGIPATVTFQTKAQLGQAMLTHAWAVGIAGGWVTADEAYGHDGVFRRWLTQQGMPSVLAVPSNEHVWVIDGEERWEGTVSAVAATLPTEAWQRISCGEGTKGPRLYDWAWVRVAGLVRAGWGHWLLTRRSLSDPTDLAYYLVAGPTTTTVEQALRVAGARWTIECCLEEAKGETGLDEYEVRSWQSWHRHITLSLVAHAFLATLRATDAARTRDREGKRRGRDGHDRALGAGGAQTAGAGVRDERGGGTLPSALVTLAQAPSGRSQTRPLPPAYPSSNQCPAS
jgi:SRSO17 transposase